MRVARSRLTRSIEPDSYTGPKGSEFALVPRLCMAQFKQDRGRPHKRRQLCFNVKSPPITGVKGLRRYLDSNEVSSVATHRHELTAMANDQLAATYRIVDHSSVSRWFMMIQRLVRDGVQSRYEAGNFHSHPPDPAASKISVPDVAGTSRTSVPVTFSAGPILEGIRSSSFKHPYAGEVSSEPL